MNLTLFARILCKPLPPPIVLVSHDMSHMWRHNKCRYGRITVSFNGKIEKVEKVALCSVMLFHTNTRSLFLTSTPNSKWGPYSRTRFSLMLVSCFTRRARDNLLKISTKQQKRNSKGFTSSLELHTEVKEHNFYAQDHVCHCVVLKNLKMLVTPLV